MVFSVGYITENRKVNTKCQTKKNTGKGLEADIYNL